METHGEAQRLKWETDEQKEDEEIYTRSARRGGSMVSGAVGKISKLCPHPRVTERRMTVSS